MKYFFERFSFQHIGKIPLVLLVLVCPRKSFAQNNCDDFIYGQSKDQTSFATQYTIVCKGASFQFGVTNTTQLQDYYFIKEDGANTTQLDGPLDGNGGTVSISCFINSAADIYEANYYVIYKMKEGCLDSGLVVQPSNLIYGSVDNLHVLSQSGNTVQFGWTANPDAASYNLLVSTSSDPNSSAGLILNTPDYSSDLVDITESLSGLEPNTTYYIHVRPYIKDFYYNSGQVFGDPCWQTVSFTTCSPAGTDIVISPAVSTISAGGTQLLTVTGGENMQWYRNGAAIAGANSATFLASQCGEYTVNSTSLSGCATLASNAVIISMVNLPKLTLSPGTSRLCDTSFIILTASGGSPGLDYQWFRNGTEIPGIDRNVYKAFSPGTYTVNVKACSTIGEPSNQAIIRPSPNISADHNVSCIGEEVILKIFTYTDETYTWKKGSTILKGPDRGSDADQQLLVPINSPEDAGDYKVLINAPGCEPIEASTPIYLSAIKGLDTIYVSSNAVVFKWDRVSPYNLYQYGITADPIPPDEGLPTSDTTVSVGSLSPATNYYIHVRSQCGTVGTYSNWASIPFTTPSVCPPRGRVILDEVQCYDNYYTYIFSVSGGTSYAWTADGTEIVPGSNNKFTWDNPEPGIHSVTINNVGCAIDAYDTIIIDNFPVTVQATGTNLCENADVVLTARGLVKGAHFQWFKDGVEIYYAYDSIYRPVLGGIYTVTLTWGDPPNFPGNFDPRCFGQTSNEIYVVGRTIAPPLDGISGAYCPGDSVKLKVFTYPGQQYFFVKDNRDTVLGPYNGNGDTLRLRFTLDSPSQAGVYKVVTTKTGCLVKESNDIRVTLSTPQLVSGKVGICEGQNYTLPSGKIISENGFYQDTVKATGGCDSLITRLELNVITLSRQAKDVSICPGESYMLPSGNIVNTGGLYIDTVKSIGGCDSLITTVNLIVPAFSDTTIFASVCSGETYTLPWGASASSTGIYRDTLRYRNGCDSVRTTVDLTVRQLSIISTKATVCAGQSYTLPWGIVINATGIYQNSLHYSDGCDSVRTIVQLTVQPLLVNTIAAIICEGETYVLPSGEVVREAGTYRDSLHYLSGCDSIQTTINLTVQKPQSTDLDVTICAGQSYLLPSGIAVNKSGIYRDTLHYASGCDSLRRTVNLHVTPAIVISSAASICTNDFYPLPWGPQVNTAGNYRDTIKTAAGCDSLIQELLLTVLPAPTIRATKSNDVNCTLAITHLNVSSSGTYAWSPASSLDNAFIPNPVASPAISTVYVVTVTAPNGCIAKDSIEVKFSSGDPKQAYLVPSSFSPNNDGLNDCFGVPYWGNVSEFSFMIYNRYGFVVFETNNPSNCWDGRFKGQNQNSGAYIYYLKANGPCGPVSRQGTVMLLR